MLGCTCQAVRGCSHIFSLFRAHLCWGGGSVENMGLVLLCRRGLYIYALELCCLYECYEQTCCHDSAWGDA